MGLVGSRAFSRRRRVTALGAATVVWLAGAAVVPVGTAHAEPSRATPARPTPAIAKAPKEQPSRPNQISERPNATGPLAALAGSAIAFRGAAVGEVLGASTNELHIGFASVGYDTNGAATAGWTPEQVATMTSFFDRMYPLLVQRYGPPATNYTVTLVRDLRYHSSNIFIPADDEIRMDDGWHPQLFTHELVHAFRNDYLLSSDSNWNYNSTLSGFEESFAQAVSYDAMNDYVAAYPDDTLVPGNSLWGSSNDWDYDFQNVKELRGTDFWSDGGGTGLYWLRYEMGAAAMRKIEIEAPGFYARFNAEYYRRINAAPVTVRPTRGFVVDTIAALVPSVEGVATAQWIDGQHIFWAANVYGEKVFHRVQDYPAGEFFVFDSIYFTDTMPCGSEWACWDGQQWNYHRLNGAQGQGRVSDSSGSTVWTGPLAIDPALNPSDGYFGFGWARKNLTTATSTQPWPGDDPSGYVLGMRQLGLYRFDASFADPATNATTSNGIYRVLGSELVNSFGGVYGGVVGHANGTIRIDHEGFAPEPVITVRNGAFAAPRSWTGVANVRTGGHDSVPGRVFITFTDSATGLTYRTQRNIDYGSATGSQMFLLQFDAPVPTIKTLRPRDGGLVVHSRNAVIRAIPNVTPHVVRVDISVDGVPLCTRTKAPFRCKWPVPASVGTRYTISVRAVDGSGNETTSVVHAVSK